LQRLRGARDFARQVGVRDAAAQAALVPEHEGVAAVAAAHQVLGDIEARFRVPARAGHLVAVDQHRRALARGDHAACVPDLAPEFLGMRDRPVVELAVAVGVELALADHLAGELRHLRFFDRALGRFPELFRCHG